MALSYKHPCMSLKSFNSEHLKPFLHKVCSGSENKQLILLGDFNVNLLNVKEDPESSAFLDSYIIIYHVFMKSYAKNMFLTIFVQQFSYCK